MREPPPGTDLDGGRPGLGVALWLATDNAQELHDRLAAADFPILSAPQDGPFGRTFTFTGPEGYTLTLHKG
ncbi:VOC family protein [Actinomadura kijaniata]|uniref:VOC family protein n=1 Tax=Actinomadura kijaniata TaxID=46161 RepID=UPI003F1DA3F5